MAMMEALRRTYPVKVWQAIMWTTAITALWIGGIYGASSYVSDKSELARRESAAARYAAEVASYQNARDERARCEQAVTARADLRGVLLGIFNVIDNERSHQLVIELRAQLERDYPARRLEDCPPIPVEPAPIDLANLGG